MATRKVKATMDTDAQFADLVASRVVSRLEEKRGMLHTKLCVLIEEHDMHEVVWMIGQILDDRGERLTFSGSALDITGEQLRDRAVLAGGEYTEVK